ncbi:hypothetical protein BPAE_0008g00240 [Botrytis paeoniae]|uniref:Uncharacterized protein n=1 Tax=Botrytis paeoniae TaxID=278948 RepID=A0A4Z1G3Q9_9HELO|nr:hypothetical protein BPAE_0008g00240 [Botrytis paeoniae]
MVYVALQKKECTAREDEKLLGRPTFGLGNGMSIGEPKRLKPCHTACRACQVPCQMHAWSNSSRFPLPWIGEIVPRDRARTGNQDHYPQCSGSGRLEYTRALWIGLFGANK